MASTAEPFAIPAHWAWTTMGEIAEVIGGSTPKSKEPSFWGGEIPWLGVSDLTGYTDKHISRGARSITQDGYDSCSTRMLPAGAVLFSSRAPIGYVAIAAQPLCTSQGFKSFVPHAGIDADYVYWYLRFAKPMAEQRASGTTFRELSGKAAAALPIPLPPLSEQREIARRIEANLARVDAAVRPLAAAAAALPRYRASRLAAAFADAASVVELQELAEVQSGIAKGRPVDTAALDVPYISTANVQALRLDLGVVKRLVVTDEQRVRHRLQNEDVLILEGGDADKVGRGWIWEGQIDECLHQNHVFAVRTDRAVLLPRYLAYFVNAPQARRYFGAAAKQTTNLASINKRQLRELPVCLHDVARQQQVIEDLDRHIAEIARFEAILQDNLNRAEDLRRSLMHRAFSGRLTPHAAESATDLIEGIASSRSASPSGKKPRAVPVGG